MEGRMLLWFWGSWMVGVSLGCLLVLLTARWFRKRRCPLCRATTLTVCACGQHQTCQNAHIWHWCSQRRRPVLDHPSPVDTYYTLNCLLGQLQPRKERHE